MAKSIQYYSRALHRVLGYLAVGMVMVYAISGVTLIYRSGDFLKRNVMVEKIVERNLDAMQLGESLKIKNFKVLEENDSSILFEQGRYDKMSGAVAYTVKETVAPIDRFVKLHKLSEAKNHNIAIITTIFGVVLFLLALTSLVMYKPGSKQFKSNMILTVAGVVFAVIIILML